MGEHERKFIVTLRGESPLTVDDVQHAVISAYPASTDIDADNTDVELVEVLATKPISEFKAQSMTYRVMEAC